MADPYEASENLDFINARHAAPGPKKKPRPAGRG
jgi:hypothetical protein